MIVNEYYIITGIPKQSVIDQGIYESDKPVFLSQYHMSWTSVFPQAIKFDTLEDAMTTLYGGVMESAYGDVSQSHCEHNTWSIMKVATIGESVTITDSEKLKFHIKAARQKLTENELAALKMDMLSGVNLCKCD